MNNKDDARWPQYDDEEIAAVVDILKSGKVNYWTGKQGKLFEEEFARFCGCNFAVALSNGTIALELCLKVLGIGENNGGQKRNEVIVTPRSFVASASVILAAGAHPIFADVDPLTGNISRETIAPLLNENTVAIILVHMSGWPCDFDEIIELIENKQIKLIEDCAQAHGALYKGKNVGSIGEVAAWSFCQDKIISTAGEGGMVTTNNKEIWEKLWSLKDHGKNHAKVYGPSGPPGFRWLHDSIGTNARMTEIQAACGRIQLAKIKDTNFKRATMASAITKVLKKYSSGKMPLLKLFDFKCRECDDLGKCHCRNAFYNLYVHLVLENLPNGWTRNTIVDNLQSEGLPVRHGGCTEIYKEKAFAQIFPKIPACPCAAKMGQTSIMFDLNHKFNEKEIQEICEKLSRFFNQLTM